jgi:5-formyltetrahydrofolate cyclo-ligase
MTKHTDHLKKWDIRLDYLNKRERVSPERREEAKLHLFSFLKEKLAPFQFILSFYSTRSEIDTLPINEWILHHKTLILPRVEDPLLSLYEVKDLDHSLITSSWGLLEPDPSICPQIALQQVDCILVPGIVFDHHFHRLGYGKGHYDRLFQQNQRAQTIGIGFIEQSYEGALPTEPHDRPLNSVALF